MAIEPTDPGDPSESEELSEPQPRWGLGDAAAGFLMGLLWSSLLASLVLAGQAHKEDLGLGGQALSQLGLWFGLAGSAIYASRRKGSRRLSEDFGLRIELADVPVGLVAGIAAQLILIPGLALLLSPLLGKPEVSGPVEDLLDSAKGFALVGLFLFVVVGAPLVEELFFRGLLFRSLRRRLRPAYAIGIAGVLFGLAHPQDLPVKALVLVMVSLAAFGALLAYLAHRYGRLGPCIVAHAAFNAWTLTILLRK